MKTIKVVELFAGVGGFSLGLKQASEKFITIFSNQWEPSSKSQFAFRALEKNFKDEKNITLSNEDISIAKYDIPKDFELLVGGFPCQDYSVASTNAKGIQGKKGVLWWEISWILKNRQPKFVFLENVDRLLKSPSNNRGRDFAIMLKNFDLLGYDVEWRMINSAEYGFSQRRKRIYIFANLKKEKKYISAFEKFAFLSKDVKEINLNTYIDELDITNNYNDGSFLNMGKMSNGNISMNNFQEVYLGAKKNLKDIIETKVDINNEYLILNEDKYKKIEYMKASKKIERKKPNGEKYFYSEGAMNMFDDLNKASRTMLTSEGTTNRSTHVIKLKDGKSRFLSPLECERLNGFDDNWTAEVMTNRQRYFCMGNALVVGVIKLIGESIDIIINS